MLIEAGRGTAGKKGGLGQLAGALGGAGESLIGSNAAAGERAVKQEALEREQDLTMGKLREEVAGKKRAAAEGRVGDMAKHDLKIAELQQLLEDNKRDAAKSMVTDERTRSEGALNRAAQLEQSRISAGGRSGGPEAVRLKYLDQQQDSLVAQLSKIPPFQKEDRAPLEAKLAVIRQELAKLTGIDTMGDTPGGKTPGGKVFDWSQIGKQTP